MLVLGITDIIAGIILALSGLVPLSGIQLIFAIGIIYVMKGFYSTGSAAVNGFYFDLLGWFDLALGAFLILAFLGMHMGIFLFLGIAVTLKGLYTFSVSILKA